jgi:predicted TIM-barrel fold metal-dependent hydrolase
MTPIIDAHHHIWRQADLPWLNGPERPRIFGPYRPIMRDYPIDEYLAEARPAGVVKSVYVQTNWPVEQAVEEVAWVEACAQATGWPHAIVGYCNLLGDDVDEVLAAQAAASPRMRGIRMQLHWHDNPLYRFASRPDLADDPKLRHSLARLQRYGWLFELQVFAGQMAGAARLAAALPEVTFVLIHAGMPEDLSPDGLAAWRAGLAQLAARPNCHVKLSGLGTFIHAVSAPHLEAVILPTIELFGVGRCVFGSNFPIEKLWSSYGALVDGHRAVLGRLTEAEQRAILHDNAAALYRI